MVERICQHRHCIANRVHRTVKCLIPRCYGLDLARTDPVVLSSNCGCNHMELAPESLCTYDVVICVKEDLEVLL
jgi:hypothetical protein